MNKLIRYVILAPIAMIYMPLFALALLMNPIDLYKEFFKHLKSGESFGMFD